MYIYDIYIYICIYINVYIVIVRIQKNKSFFKMVQIGSQVCDLLQKRGLDVGRNLPMYQYCEELKRKVQNNRDLEFFGECAGNVPFLPSFAEFRICLVSLELMILEGLEVC